MQLRNLQTLIELGVNKNTTVVFPAPLMSTIGDIADFLGRESSSAAKQTGRNLATPVQDLMAPPLL